MAQGLFVSTVDLKFYFYVYGLIFKKDLPNVLEHFARMYVCVSRVCLVLEEARRGHWVPGTGVR